MELLVNWSVAITLVEIFPPNEPLLFMARELLKFPIVPFNVDVVILLLLFIF